VTVTGDRALLTLKGQQSVNEVLERIRTAKAKLISLTPQNSPLEDLFMREVREQRGEE
jgi:molybdopterin-guanine dinucleotide biosynthesis protein A